ncbi:MAG: TIGR04086 family membrane protein [Desulfitobacteriaceae bacterium]|nr:TIGR04086 family membrane protein [Desulfitobacteriaceae bacterium]MDD4347126.1 TIGR04086 family membrane protein [Desulfitobacteriaceae bacterium]MDD4402949.1 TIGR04086 family membrane protein [Desulfitobacteriaceae bacterium]
MANSFKISLVLKGILIAASFAMVLSLGYGLLLSISNLPESDPVFSIIFSFSIFAAALIITNKAGSKGLIYGLFIGLGFIILLLLSFGIFFSEHISLLKIGERLIFALVAGSIGGIFGVLFRRS